MVPGLADIDNDPCDGASLIVNAITDVVSTSLSVKVTETVYSPEVTVVYSENVRYLLFGSVKRIGVVYWPSRVKLQA